jgi:hypothetical protein
VQKILWRGGQQDGVVMNGVSIKRKGKEGRKEGGRKE